MKSLMNTIVKILLRPFWKLSGPIRRPLVQKFDDRIARIVAPIIVDAVSGHRQAVHFQVDQPDFRPIEAVLGTYGESLRMARQVAEHHAEEANLLMDSLVREMARLQIQVEALGEIIENSQAMNGLAVVGREQTASQLRAG